MTLTEQIVTQSRQVVDQQPVPGSQIVQWERIKTSKEKIRRARLGKDLTWRREKWESLSPVPARFSHFLLLNDFPPAEFGNSKWLKLTQTDFCSSLLDYKSNYGMGKPTRSKKKQHLGFKYLLLCVSKLEEFTQLLYSRPTTKFPER